MHLPPVARPFTQPALFVPHYPTKRLWQASAQGRRRSTSLRLRFLSTSNTGSTSGWRRGAVLTPPPPPTPTPTPDARYASAMGWVGVAALTVACLTMTSAASPADSCTTHAVAADAGPGFAARGKGERSAAGGDGSGGGDVREENASLVAAAHELRRSLTPPHQSLFRVVCILVYEDFSGNLHRITGEWSTVSCAVCCIPWNDVIIS